MASEKATSARIAVKLGILFALVAFCVAGAQNDTSSSPTDGGTITVALSGSPESLDSQLTTAGITGLITSHWMERLVEFDEHFTPQPHLASEIIVSDDALRYVFPLRQGVRFHNGKELVAEDVVASLKRWMQVSTRGSTAAPFIEEVSATDSYTVEILLNKPFGPLLSLLAYAASSQAAIYPAEIVNEAGRSPITDHIGTGPYMFEEWLPDRFISVVRFEDYQASGLKASGYSGTKTAHLDRIRFQGVSDAAARLAGVQTGDFHYAVEMPSDVYESVVADSRLKPVIVESVRKLYAHFNKSQGIATDRWLRRAINAALDQEQIAIAAVGLPEFFEINHNHIIGASRWQNDAGEDLYNQADSEQARALAERAGYAGEAVRLLVSPDYQEHYMASLAATEQLQDAGFEVELQAVEWTTLLDRRGQPELYDVFITHHGSKPEPALYAHLFSPAYPGWWEDEKRTELAEDYFTAPNAEAAEEAWKRFQEYAYDEMSSIPLVTVHGLDVSSEGLHGMIRKNSIVTFWNVWLDLE